MSENRAANLLEILREIYQDNGFMFHAFEIKKGGAYLYYKGEKFGPLQGNTYAEDQVREKIMEIIHDLCNTDY